MTSATETQGRLNSARDIFINNCPVNNGGSNDANALSEAVDAVIHEGIGQAFNPMAAWFAEETLGASRHERTKAWFGHRSGSRARGIKTPYSAMHFLSDAFFLLPPFA